MGTYTRLYSRRMTVADRLNDAMINAKYKSQSDLARASGVPQATISRILKGAGKKGPETETLKKLALACRVSFTWLNEGVVSRSDAESKSAKSAIPSNNLTANQNGVTADEIIELIDAYKTATSADRILIMRLAKSSAKKTSRKKVARPARGR